MTDPTSHSDLDSNIEQRKRNARRTALLMLVVVLAVYFTYIYMNFSGS